MSRKLSKNEKIGLWTVIVAVVGLGIGVFQPEIRTWLHLDRPGATMNLPASIQQNSEGPNSPNIVGSDNQVNITAPPSRVLTPQRAANFRKALSAFPGGSFGILEASTSDDVLPLDAQLTEQAKAAGWNILKVEGLYTSAGPPVADGLECYLRGGWSTPMGVAFKSAMRAAGLQCKYFSKSYSLGGATVYDGAVALVVGRNVAAAKD